MNMFFANLDTRASDGCFALEFSNNWDYVSIVRDFLYNYTSLLLKNNLKADAFTIIASELIENAVKYSPPPVEKSQIRMEMIHDANNKKIQLKIENLSNAENISILKKDIGNLKLSDSAKNYIEKIIVTGQNNKTMLGLARIRYETGCELFLDITDLKVTVTAIYYL